MIHLLCHKREDYSIGKVQFSDLRFLVTLHITCARDRQIPVLRGENRLQNGNNAAQDGYLAIPSEQK